MDISSTHQLNNGVKMPVFGLGTYKLAPGEETIAAATAALECGYRLIDTAALYGNEADVAAAIRRSGIRREDVFVTTKLWNDSHGYAQTLAAFEASRKRLRTDYIDLYLIHWPASHLISETWRALEKLLQEGYCRAIGVSNFTECHLESLLRDSNTIPAVNQVELHPFLAQAQLRSWCESRKIRVQAWRSLMREDLRNDTRITRIAERHAAPVHRILLRWALQHDLMVIPKSARADKVRENADVFSLELSPADMAELDSLDSGLRLGPDPSSMPR